MKAYYALDRFRRGASFAPWLFRIVANEARNRRRAAGRRARLSIVASRAERPPLTPSPETEVLIDEERRGLLGAVQTLRDEDRLIVTYRYLMELSEAETAEALGIKAGTVKSRLSRALGRLRVALALEDPSAATEEGASGG